MMKAKLHVVMTVGLVLSAVEVCAAVSIKDATVIGHWKFDGADASARLADSSGYGSDLRSDGFDSGVSTLSGSGFDGNGCLNIETAGNVARATLGAGAAFDQTGYHTLVARFKSGKKYSNLTSKAILKVISDTANWHFAAMRYHYGAGTGSSYKYMIVCDPAYDDSNQWNGSSSSTEEAENTLYIPVGVSGTTVEIGGKIGIKNNAYDYVGALDEVMVINRLLAKRELTRLYQTGETYVYPCACPSGKCPAFDGNTYWSTKDNTYQPVPGDVKGAAYIIDSGIVFKTPDEENADRTFGREVANNVSLTIGRPAPLKSVLTGDVIVSEPRAYLQQEGTASKLTVADLRLNAGGIFSAKPNQRLHVLSMSVDAPVTAPFRFAVTYRTTYVVTGTASGSGYMSMENVGTLDLSGLGGSVRVKLSAGGLKLPSGCRRLCGYTGGTLYVQRADVVNNREVEVSDAAITDGADLATTFSWPLNVAVEGDALDAGRYKLVSVPKTVKQELSESDLSVTATCIAGMSSRVEVETVGNVHNAYLKVGYPSDDGDSPILIGE